MGYLFTKNIIIEFQYGNHTMFILEDNVFNGSKTFHNLYEMCIELFEFNEEVNNIFQSLMHEEANSILTENPNRNTFQKAVDKIGDLIRIFKQFITSYFYKLANFIKDKGDAVKIAGGENGLVKNLSLANKFTMVVGEITKEINGDDVITDSTKASLELKFRKAIRDLSDLEATNTKEEKKPVPRNKIVKVIEDFRKLFDKLTKDLELSQQTLLRARSQNGFNPSLTQNKEVLLAGIVRSTNLLITSTSKFYSTMSIYGETAPLDKVVNRV